MATREKFMAIMKDAHVDFMVAFQNDNLLDAASAIERVMARLRDAKAILEKESLKKAEAILATMK